MSSNHHHTNTPKTDDELNQQPIVKFQSNAEAMNTSGFDNGLCRSDIETSESENEDLIDDGVINQNIEQKRNSRRSQRMSVCAEVYGEYNPIGPFQPKVLPKDSKTQLTIRQLLSNNFLFKHLEDRDIDIIINAMEIRKVKSAEVVIAQGQDGNDLYIVGNGQLRCTKALPDSNEAQFIKDYETGEYFGELALLYNAPRAATITAVTDSVLYSVDRECFTHIIKESAMKNRHIYEQFLSEVEVLQSLDSYERSKLCDCLKVKIFESGKKVITQGDTGNTFYLIVEGEAQAFKLNPSANIEEAVLDYHPKMYFGELALLKDEPRAATVIAKVRLLDQTENCVD
jgi:cAMP-dependent protein kinase regulator